MPGQSFTDMSNILAPTNMDLSVGSAWVDANNDGFLDVYVGGHENLPDYEPDMFLLNNGGSGFAEAWEEAGTLQPGRGITAADFDRDGDQDIYVSKYRSEPNLLWLNDGSKTAWPAYTRLRSSLPSKMGKPTG